jgi:hypothetical protein
MTGDSDMLVLLAQAPNSAVAGLWGTVLDGAGIVRHLSRNFELHVPRSRLEEARRLIEQWKFQSRYAAGPNEAIDNP